MTPMTTPFERVLHLVLFLSAGVAFGVLAIAGLERITEGARRTVRRVHIVPTTAIFVALFIAERIYHIVNRVHR